MKLEIHPDPRYLLPDSTETLKATEQLAMMGFIVLPYCAADSISLAFTPSRFHASHLFSSS